MALQTAITLACADNVLGHKHGITHEHDRCIMPPDPITLCGAEAYQNQYAFYGSQGIMY